MWKYNSLNEVQADLLKKHTIDLGGEVDSDMVMYVRECISRLDAKGSPEVTIKITSGGGNVECGLDIYDFLRLYKGKKTGIVTGYAKSMGAIILQACEIRQCARHAEIMIHHISKNNLSLDVIRSPKRLKKEAVMMEESQRWLYDVICKRTGNERKTVVKKCAEDRNMPAEEALKFGLIDEII